MKKTNWAFVLSELAIAVAVSMIAGIGIAAVCGAKYVVSAGIQLGIFLLILIGIFRIVMGSVITNAIAKKTMDKLSEEEFSNGGTFYSSGSIIRIDTVTGRIAYVSSGNPFQVQIVSAKEISEIETYCMKGTFGGTRYVAFQFSWQNQKFRFPTFTSRQTYSMDAEEVVDAIAMADDFCDRLKKAQFKAGKLDMQK